MSNLTGGKTELAEFVKFIKFIKQSSNTTIVAGAVVLASVAVILALTPPGVLMPTTGDGGKKVSHAEESARTIVEQTIAAHQDKRLVRLETQVNTLTKHIQTQLWQNYYGNQIKWEKASHNPTNSKSVSANIHSSLPQYAFKTPKTDTAEAPAANGDCVDRHKVYKKNKENHKHE